MWSNNYSKVLNRLGGITIRVLAFRVVDRGYDPRRAIPKSICSVISLLPLLIECWERLLTLKNIASRQNLAVTFILILEQE